MKQSSLKDKRRVKNVIENLIFVRHKENVWNVNHYAKDRDIYIVPMNVKSFITQIKFQVVVGNGWEQYLNAVMA